MSALEPGVVVELGVSREPKGSPVLKERLMDKVKKQTAASKRRIQRLKKELGITDSPKTEDDDPDCER